MTFEDDDEEEMRATEEEEDDGALGLLDGLTQFHLRVRISALSLSGVCVCVHCSRLLGVCRRKLALVICFKRPTSA